MMQDAAPGGAEGPVRAAGVRLVHVTTVPESLIFLSGQTRFMKERGFEVVYVSSPGPLLCKFAGEENVAAHAIDMPRRVTPLKDLEALGRMALLLKRLSPQIVHAHTPKGGLLGTLGARLAGVPIRLYHMRGLPMLAATGMRRRVLTWSEKTSCGFAHSVFCVSHSVREVAVAEGLCRADKIEVLGSGSGNGVDAEGLFDPSKLPDGAARREREHRGIPPESLVIGFVGRLVRDKGIVELAETWRSLRDDFPNLRLLLVGDYEPQDIVPGDVRGLLKNDPRVHCTGFVDRTEMPALYRVMDILVHPSYREGFPNVVLEAAAMEIPVVATRIPGCVDAVAEETTGLLVPARDPAALGQALRAYLGDPGKRAAHGRSGRTRAVREFRPERIWRALYEEYVRLLRENGLHVPVWLDHNERER